MCGREGEEQSNNNSIASKNVLQNEGDIKIVPKNLCLTPKGCK